MIDTVMTCSRDPALQRAYSKCMQVMTNDATYIDLRVRSRFTQTYQIIEDVSLMHVNGDKRLKLRPHYLGQFLSRLLDQHVQQF